ncbi:MAG: thioredoxin domain-containing protein [Deltaproteobacteria bacterium]|nr:thioredoxin domain-containing protein [Deltaproteobacteria bacterium]
MKRTESRTLSLIIATLSLAGAILSFISLYHYVEFNAGLQSGPSFCNINAAFNCDAVNQSEWSTFLGFPVASYGLAFYLVLFCLSFLSSSTKLMAPAAFRSVLLFLSLIASLVSVALFIVSEFVIGTLCLICIGMYLVNFALFAVAWRAAEHGLIRGSLIGFRNLVALPLLLLGLGEKGADEQNAGLARFSVASMLFVALLSFGMGDIILVRLSAMKEQRSGDVASQVAELLKKWREQPVVNIEIEAEGAGKDYFKGPDNAPIVLVEFSDYECPACRHFYRIVEELLPKYRDQVKIVYKNYPLDPLCNLAMTRGGHANACLAAYAARCSGEQGMFWEATDYLFSTLEGADVQQGQARIAALPQALSLDETAFKECLTAERTKRKIASDIRQGGELQVAGTPSIWINGRAVEVFAPQVIEAIFNDIISKQ